MNLIDAVLSAGNGALVPQLAKQFGTDPQSTQSAVAMLTQVLGRGLSQKTASPTGLEGLLGALGRGNHGNYMDDLGSLLSPGGTADGNGILGHILGSKDMSRGVAAQVSSRTGVDNQIVKKMLPVVAGLVMSALAKQNAQGGLQSAMAAAPRAAAAPRSPLASILDANNDGSVADDLLKLAGQFMRR